MNALSLLSTALPLLTEDGGGNTDSPGGGLNFLPIILILVIFYVVLIMPERKKQKQRQAMLDTLSKGNRIMTSSGIYGTVAAIHDDVVTVQVADGVRMRFNRAAIQDILDKDAAEAVEKKDETTANAS